MSRTSVGSGLPEERELENKKAILAKLESELADRELHFATFQNELRAFETRYLRAVGPLFAELDDLEARIAEAHTRERPHDQTLHDQAAQARAKADESAGAVGAVLKDARHRLRTGR